MAKNRYPIRSGPVAEAQRGRPRVYPINELAVSQYFETADATYHTLYSCAHRYQRAHCGECMFVVTRAEVDGKPGWRVTRVK